MLMDDEGGDNRDKSDIVWEVLNVPTCFKCPIIQNGEELYSPDLK